MPSLTGATGLGAGTDPTTSLMSSLAGVNSSLSSFTAGIPGLTSATPLSTSSTGSSTGSTSDLSSLGVSGSIGQLMTQLSTMMTQLTTMISSLLQQIQTSTASSSTGSLATPQSTGSDGTDDSSDGSDGSSGTSGSDGGSTSSGSSSSSSSGGSGSAEGNMPTNGNIHGITPDQGAIDDPDKWSMCGIVAAKAFANASGKNISIEDIKKIAVQNGLWDANEGMHGPASENELLSKIGVNANETDSVDWDKVKQQVQSGKPVIIDTPEHYFVVEGYDPTTGKFDFGNSAKILKSSGGVTQYTPQELEAKFGSNYTPRAAIYLNS